MTPDAVTQVLTNVFPDAQINQPDRTTWKVHHAEKRFHLLVNTSKNGEMLRVFVPIAPQKDAEPYYEKLLEQNFDENKLVRYAISQNMIWGAFKYPIGILEAAQLQQALEELIELHKKNLRPFFNELAENKVREIVAAAKAQGQTMEMTMQTITRFYQEGVMGGLDQEPRQRQQALIAWQYQLERLWNETSD
ncbi:hypothetical protein Lepto7376_1978 [[Leptolyngbya] sp. PCC 7376]|uniref:hypothetical protein n=1 Tax=[Leptolyngbya] sp. PCC 7376 TaxID=111781 RepID=UPI00029EF4EC|nr:hypothetical protein [[Leptolyngbya] sp. PCC 7376]AFY38288.1 hypothetical protein Lepto7376_1978 [[Leptolyngbya] sp. PCC 7376]